MFKIKKTPILKFRVKLTEAVEAKDTVWVIEKRGAPVAVLIPFELLDELSPKLKEELYRAELEELKRRYAKDIS